MRLWRAAGARPRLKIKCSLLLNQILPHKSPFDHIELSRFALLYVEPPTWTTWDLPPVEQFRGRQGLARNAETPLGGVSFLCAAILVFRLFQLPTPRM